MPAPADLDRCFPRYRDFNPAVPVWCLTPDSTGWIHRFFDTNPISPSGRFLAVFRLPFEDRQPKPGEPGEVHLVDLQTGSRRRLAETIGWEPQLGANLNWGGSDEALFFNDVDPESWTPFSWMLNPLTGHRQRMEGPVYHASPDGRWLVAADPRRMRKTQPGYGVQVPDEAVRQHRGAVSDDGFYLTDTATGKTRLAWSFQDLLARADPPVVIETPDRMEVCAFHSKFSPGGDRLMLSLRWFPALEQPRWNLFATDPKAVRFAWVTVRLEGGPVHCVVGPEQWIKGGHHATWYPDGKRISMNLNLHGDGLRFVSVCPDGSDLSVMVDGLPGSGHPSLHPSGRHLLTDTYTFEPTAFGDGTIPLRWIDLASGGERTLVRINTAQPCSDGVLRVDPHPAWDRSGRFVTFNAHADGARRVYLADLATVL
ncbi:MAG: hypothetical protein EA425_05555 [Puniceicoccaceae bacterium]|nr:MAG: hypothetical protein EA425_05555 [Puniceicoccaceae bacterium]